MKEYDVEPGEGVEWVVGEEMTEPRRVLNSKNVEMLNHDFAKLHWVHAHQSPSDT